MDYNFPSSRSRLPSAVFSVNVPRDGWYTLNFEILLQFNNESGNFIHLKTGRYSYALPPQNELEIHRFMFEGHRFGDPWAPRRSLPQLLDLAAGYHSFGLYLRYPLWAELIEVSITELER